MNIYKYNLDKKAADKANSIKGSGVYCFWNKNELLYIGKSRNLGNRIYQSALEKLNVGLPITIISYRKTKTEADSNILEVMLITENKSVLNSANVCGDLPVEFPSKLNIKKFKKIKVKPTKILDELKTKYEEHKIKFKKWQENILENQK